MAANQAESPRFVIKFWLTEKCKPCEIFLRMCDVSGKACSGQNQKKLTDCLVKKTFYLQQSVKKAMLTVFWDMKELITINFLEKDATVNSASYCQLLRQYFTLFIEWTSLSLIHHWSGRPAFNPRSCHTKDFKNGTWCLPT